MFGTFFLNRAVYEIMCKTFVEQGRPHMIVRPMRIACWIPKATNAHTGCVILIAFPLQQWLHERASMLRCTYISGLVMKKNRVTNNSRSMLRFVYENIAT